MHKWIKNVIERYRKKRNERGYTCDCCGREVFDYPYERLCDDCKYDFPRVEKGCPKCGRKITSDGVCLECKERMPAFFFAVSAFTYEGNAAKMVNRFKNGERYLANFFAESLAPLISARFSAEKICLEDCVFTCVPDLEKERAEKRERRYNPAEILAEETCLRLGVPLFPQIMMKSRSTAPQKKMTKSERSENVRGAYRVHERARCAGKTLAVFDDVLTTGATGSECARILLAAGARRVVFVTAASVASKEKSPDFAE